MSDILDEIFADENAGQVDTLLLALIARVLIQQLPAGPMKDKALAAFDAIRQRRKPEETP